MTPRDLQETLHETLRGGQAWSRRLARHQRLRLRDVEGRACVSALFYNARDPIERYNMPDTLKAQFTAFLTTGRVLYSDMGRICCSIVADDCGWHDTISGIGDAAASRARFGEGSLPGAAQRLSPQRPRQPARRAGQARPRQAGRRLERELLRPRSPSTRRARSPGRPATAAPAPPSSCASRWTRWWCCRTRRTRSIRAPRYEPPPVELLDQRRAARRRGRSLPAVAARERPRLRAHRGLRRGDGGCAMSRFRMKESTLDPAAAVGRRHAAGGRRAGRTSSRAATIFRIVDLEGNQAVDTLFFNAATSTSATAPPTRSARRATST